MSNQKMLITAILSLGILLTACGSNPGPANNLQVTPQSGIMEEAQPTEAIMPQHSTATEQTDMMVGEKPESMSDGEKGEMMEPQGTSTNGMEDSNQAMMEKPGFFQATLSDAFSGQNFAIDDFSGKVVLVETLAMWCPNCLKQQNQVKALHNLLGMRDDLVSLGLDVDPNEKIDDLRKYVTSNGFDWKYAVAPADVAREIGSLYGDQFLNPTSTPMFIIDRHGQVHPLPFGIKSAEELQKALEPFLNEQM